MKIKRIALLVPNTDTTLETDLQRALPADWVIHTARMQLDEVGEEAERRMVDVSMHEAIASLKGITHFDLAVFGCTSASAVYGKEGLHRIEKTLSDEFGCPAISALGAVLQKIGQSGCTRVGVMTPYTEEVTAFFVKTMRDFETTVSFHAGIGLSQDVEIAACEPEKILAFAQEYHKPLQQECDIAFFSCTNLRAFEIREQLATLLGLSVVTTNSSIIDWLLSHEK